MANSTNPDAVTDAENVRAIILMVASMALFALEDTFIKLAAPEISVGQILLVLGIIGAVFYAGLGRRNGVILMDKAQLNPLLLFRSASEVFGTFGFVTALALIDLSVASAILQATPLIVTLGAALVLSEAVGWRRWSAIMVGFLGVTMIIQPGLAGFEPNTLYAVMAAVGLSARDLVTRRIPKAIPTSIIALQAFVAVSILGAVMMALDGGWQPMSPFLWALMAAAALCGIVGYFAVTTSMRLGEVSAVAPFRYSRLVFALIIGFMVFDEVPDLWMIIGSVLIVGSGLYALYRERLRKRAQLG